MYGVEEELEQQVGAWGMCSSWEWESGREGVEADCFVRFGLGEGGREFAALEQQLRVCLRDAPSVGAAAAGGVCVFDGMLDVEADVDGKSSAQQNMAAWARAANPPLSGRFDDIPGPRS